MQTMCGSAGEELDLPDCQREDRWLELTTVEKAIYFEKYQATMSALRQYEAHGPDGEA